MHHGVHGVSQGNSLSLLSSRGALATKDLEYIHVYVHEVFHYALLRVRIRNTPWCSVLSVVNKTKKYGKQKE